MTYANHIQSNYPPLINIYFDAVLAKNLSPSQQSTFVTTHSLTVVNALLTTGPSLLPPTKSSARTRTLHSLQRNRRSHPMPRKADSKTTPMNIRLETSDLSRIDELFKYSGVHGHVGRIAREGTHLQIFIEELERERYPSSPLLLEAIHTLRVALDRRDSEQNDKGTESESSSSTTEEENKQLSSSSSS